jgi:hypothetical protein
MSFCICRSIPVAPEMTPSLSKLTASLTLGPWGARYTLSPRGNRTRRLVLAAWDQIEARREFMTWGM